jgi:hypothetical protein
MPSTISKIMFGLGALLLLAGLAFIPAGMGADGDPTVRAGGMGLFSLGALLIGLAFYVKARQAQTTMVPEKKAPAGPATPPCEACEESPQVILCTTHKAALCASCMHTHFDPRSCVFIPVSRQVAKAASARG